MFHRVDVPLVKLKKKLVCCHLFHKKSALKSLQIFSTFKFNFMFTLLPYGETLFINRKCNTRVVDFNLIHPYSWIHMTLNSHHSLVQTHHNSFTVTLANFLWWMWRNPKWIILYCSNIYITMSFSNVSRWLTLDTNLCYSTHIMRTKLTCQWSLTQETEGKIYLLVTFIQRFVTQSKLSLIFTERLLFPHKTAYFLSDRHDSYKKMATGNSCRWQLSII